MFYSGGDLGLFYAQKRINFYNDKIIKAQFCCF
jgi:hypothetical protein